MGPAEPTDLSSLCVWLITPTGVVFFQRISSFSHALNYTKRTVHYLDRPSCQTMVSLVWIQLILLVIMLRARTEPYQPHNYRILNFQTEVIYFHLLIELVINMAGTITDI